MIRVPLFQAVQILTLEEKTHNQSLRIFADNLSDMKRLLLVFLAALAFGCSDSTEPGNSSPHKIPKVGSTFTTSLTEGAFHKIDVDTVMVTGLRFNGKPNVMMMTDSSMVAFEPNGDISIPIGDANWITLPIVSKKDTVFERQRVQEVDGRYYVYEKHLHFLNVKTKALHGKNYDNLRVEMREVVKFYESNDSLTNEFDASTYTIGWIPELGWYGSTEYEQFGNPTVAETELIDFNLK
jgi:hypothetical protein